MDHDVGLRMQEEAGLLANGLNHLRVAMAGVGYADSACEVEQAAPVCSEDIRTFRALRYDEAVAGPLGSLVAPPYDVISTDHERMYLARDPRNIVRIEVGPRDATDRHAGAAALLAAWQTEGVLVRDAQPALYVTRTAFDIGDGRRRERTGITARARLSALDEGAGQILRHERTMSGPKQDRLLMLRATRANTSSVFGLYEDPAGDVALLLAPILARTPDATATDAEGAEHTLWVLDDPAAIARIVEALDPRPFLIADGHHRYETALGYAKECAGARGSAGARHEAEQGVSAPGVARAEVHADVQAADRGDALSETHDSAPAGGEHAEDFVMMYLASMEDPGLVLLGYHRTVHRLTALDPEGFLAALRERFTVTPVPEHVTRADAGPHLLARIAELGRDHVAMACAVYGRGHFLIEKRLDDPALPLRERLDAAVLEREILRGILALDDDMIRHANYLEYHHDPLETLADADAGRAQLAFVLNAVDVHTVARIAAAGQVMPQKSTWFAPKVPTGLVINVLGE